MLVVGFGWWLLVVLFLFGGCGCFVFIWWCGVGCFGFGFVVGGCCLVVWILVVCCGLCLGWCFVLFVVFVFTCLLVYCVLVVIYCFSWWGCLVGVWVCGGEWVSVCGFVG